jgi:hypothetical protein
MTNRQDLANARHAELLTARRELVKKAYRVFADPSVLSNPSDPKHADLQAEWDALDDKIRQAADDCKRADAEGPSTKSD